MIGSKIIVFDWRREVKVGSNYRACTVPIVLLLSNNNNNNNNNNNSIYIALIS